MGSSEDTPQANGKPLDSQSLTSGPKTPDYAKLARLMIREGKQFYSSALECGYSESVARRGLRALMEDSKPMTEAIKRESGSFKVSVDSLRPMAINRLYFELIDPQSPQGMKAVELTGRLKELDMFVRSTETNMGILINMNETHATPDTPIIDVSQE